MSKDKGIFEPQEGFASGPSGKSPFSVDETPNNPFAGGSDAKSPFSSDDDSAAAGSGPDKGSEPFASGSGKSPFDYQPPVAGFGGSPFEGTPSPAASTESPFGQDVAAEKKEEEKPGPPPFGDPAPAATPPAVPPAQPAATPVSSTPAAAAAAPAPSSFGSDSSSIRQLELRAIFGVDRELSEGEILQRSRSLPGIRNLARVADAEVGVIDNVRRVLGGLGFGDGQVKLTVGSAPVEFIREGRVLLAVQSDGSFAPGVRETLMIVARELGRM